jgi:NAD(P)-dependent dehydrogenase (short-subunit alcohol dehydrogenase family)
LWDAGADFLESNCRLKTDVAMIIVGWSVARFVRDFKRHGDELSWLTAGSSLISAVLMRDNDKRAVLVEKEMVSKQVAFITGANKGIGLEVARQLGAKGYLVVIGSRDAERGVKAAETLSKEGLDVRSIKVDVESESDIAALPKYFEESFGRLDVLINNAGVMLDSQDLTPENFRKTYEVNVIAPVFIIQALLPLLKQSPAGRIVNQSSILGSLTINSQPGTISTDWLAPAYNSSKAALNLLTVVLSRQLAGTNIKVNAAHPGWVKTDLGGQGAPLETPEGAETAVWLATLPANGPTGGYFHKQDVLPW